MRAVMQVVAFLAMAVATAYNLIVGEAWLWLAIVGIGYPLVALGQFSLDRKNAPEHANRSLIVALFGQLAIMLLSQYVPLHAEREKAVGVEVQR